jgi:hypothetical protein
MEDVSGRYEVTIRAMGKNVAGTVDIEVDGNRMTGTIMVIGQEIPIENGRADGRVLSGQCHADTPMGRLKLTISATTDGRAISGRIKALMGKAEFEGSRVESFRK